MKKIAYFLLLFLCITSNVRAINGNGSYGFPYNGSLTANMTWSGVVYVNDDIIINGYTLTIIQGSIIVFLTSGTDIIVTGTGILSASGGAGANMIRFSADFNNNGNFGETGERWGHISFQNMAAGFTAPSTINYCIIEFGQKNSSPFNFEAAGGGIQIAYSHLTVSNSIIRNNYAGWGGGIYVNEYSSPRIMNCIITNNTAGTTGGGISIYRYSAAILENCVINKNLSTGAGSGGGMFIGDFPENVRVYNCTVVSNTSTYNPGNNIRIWQSAPSTGPQFFNSIIWGSANSISYLGLGADATDFNFCSIQGYTSGYTNCINLNGTNDNPAGPNFINPTINDYRITSLSPCRNIGTSTGAPERDIRGFKRLLPYDLGAYEAAISWSGAIDESWINGNNWEGGVMPITDPTSYDMGIPGGLGNYPILDAPSTFTVNSRNFLIIGPGAKVTLNSLVNNGTIKLESDITGVSSLIASSYSGNNAQVQLYLTGGRGLYGPTWHYISSPFNTLSTDSITENTDDLAQWVEEMANADLSVGWVAYDGFIYNQSTGGPPYAGPQFNSLAPGKGYNHYSADNHLYTLTGQLNTTTTTVNLQCTDPLQKLRYGLNLLGNPFSSGLDWDVIANGAGFPANTSKAIYFNRSGGIVYYVNGVGSSGVTGTIPPMQGFFTKTYSQDNTITLSAAARTHSDMPTSRYKGAGKPKSDLIPLVRMNISSGIYEDNAVVRFANDAKTGLDYDYDAEKLFLNATKPYIYSVSDDTKFAINGLPFPEPTVEIPLVINISATGTHKITATQIQGLENYPVMLIDTKAGSITDLKTNPVFTFTASAGLLSDRFILKVGNLSTGNEDPVGADGLFKIYASFENINIMTLSSDWDGRKGIVRILDLTGKVLSNYGNISFSRNSMITIPSTLTKGIYIIELKTGIRRYVDKIIIR